MKGEREKQNFLSENSHIISNNQQEYEQMFEGVVQSGSSSSCSYTTNSGFCYPDVGSSSVVPSFDHSSSFTTPKSHLVDQYFVGSNSNLPDSYYRRVNNGVMMDEHGLSRQFQKLDIRNHNSDLFRNSDCNVGDNRSINVDNFGVLEGFLNVSGNGGGFTSSSSSSSPIMYRDEMNGSGRDERGFRFGVRGGGKVNHLGDSFGSNSPYDVHGHQNCLINFPVEGTGTTHHQGDECYGNGVSFPRGNNCYDRMPVYGTHDYPGNVSFPRGSEHIGIGHGNGSGNGNGNGNGGGIPRGDGIPLQVESAYGPQFVGDAMQHYRMDGYKDMMSSWPSSQKFMYKSNSNEALLEQYGRLFSGNLGSLSSVDSAQVMYPKQAGLSRGHVFYNSMREKMRAVEEREGVSPISLMKKTRHFDPYGSESSLILQDKVLNGAIGKNHHLGGRTKNILYGNTLQNIGERNLELKNPLQTERACDNGSRLNSCDLQTIYNSLVEVRGNIYLMAKDQHGCRFLQKKFDEGSFEDVQLIFNEIIEHVVELMMNSFGNYLIQKLLDVCTEEQRMRIVHVVTKDRGELVKISLNTHGTRVVQKLIESLKTRKQISLIIRALEPGFLDLIKDLNGNHVVQRCLQCLSSDDNKFIFDAAAKYCVEIATHRHGCCVLQRCIAHSTGEHRQKLIEQICSNGLTIAQDPFGNYVVQYIIELKIPSAAAQLMSMFEGNYVHLATQKFSSHVVEKCLKFCEESQPRIVYELLSVSHFEQLVQDPFANYVIRSALEVTKGAVYDSLATAVRPLSILRTNPYCKKIFSRGLLKK